MVNALRSAMWLVVVLAGCADGPRSHEVAIRGFVFDPDTIRVQLGDTVVWRNYDFAPHTATADGKSFDSGQLAANASWTLVTTAVGEQPYICALHPNMKGMLIVE